MTSRKVALVTGGSRGIGRAICVRLAKDGMDVVFSYNRGVEEAEETAKLVKEQGGEVLFVKADVSSREDCDRLVEVALSLRGRIDVLVNNAGITKDGLLLRMKDEEFEQVLSVNLDGAFYMMRAVARPMLKAKSGRVINMSSIVGAHGNPGQVNYAAAKAGIIGMTKSFAKETASRRITVNAVAPGMIDTRMTEVLPEEAKKKMTESIPMKTVGRPEDVAAAVSFLAGEDSAYITGQVIFVDGGMSI